MGAKIGLDIYNAGVRDGLFLDKKEKKYVWALVWDRWFQEKLMPPEHMKAIRESVYGTPRKKKVEDVKDDKVDKPVFIDKSSDFEDVRKIVFADTNFDSYQSWNYMGVYLYGLAQDGLFTHDQMFALWCDWSEQSSKYDPRQQSNKWETYKQCEKPRKGE